MIILIMDGDETRENEKRKNQKILADGLKSNIKATFVCYHKDISKFTDEW